MACFPVGKGDGWVRTLHMERSERELEESPERTSESEPVDGPSREPGEETDPGATSQDQPN